MRAVKQAVQMIFNSKGPFCLAVTKAHQHDPEPGGAFCLACWAWMLLAEDKNKLVSHWTGRSDCPGRAVELATYLASVQPITGTVLHDGQPSMFPTWILLHAADAQQFCNSTSLLLCFMLQEPRQASHSPFTALTFRLAPGDASNSLSSLA